MLYKSRSFSSCILAAYQLMSKNLRNILKATWLPVLIYVFILASFLLINLPNEEVVALGRTPYTNFWGTLRQDDKAPGDPDRQGIPFRDRSRLFGKVAVFIISNI